MAAVEQIKVDTVDLELGMFVSALDRPWSQTSFPLQGFALKSHREITALRTLCQYVYVDASKSSTSDPDKLQNRTQRKDPEGEQYRASASPLKLKHERYQRMLGLPDKKDMDAARIYFRKAGDSLNRIYDQIKQGANVDEQVVNMTSSLLVRSAVENPAATTWMALLQSKGDGLYGQALRSATWGLLCARHMGLDEFEIKRLAAGLLLKDVYRAKLADDMSETESVEETVKMLRESGVHPKVISVVKYHREKFNGTGKPYGFAGEKIPLLARIAALAVGYDRRIYPIDGAPGVSPSEAAKYLYEQRGRAFQEEIVVEFIEAIGLYPLGAFVELNTGETACIVKTNPKRRLKPEIVILRDRQGQVSAEPERFSLDDEAKAEGRKIKIDLPHDPTFSVSQVFEDFISSQFGDSSRSGRSVFGALFG